MPIVGANANPQGLSPLRPACNRVTNHAPCSSNRDGAAKAASALYLAHSLRAVWYSRGDGATMDKRAVWIKDPLAILAGAADRGIVVQGHRIVELVPAGGTPATVEYSIFEAGAHVVVPGLINTH